MSEDRQISYISVLMLSFSTLQVTQLFTESHDGSAKTLPSPFNGTRPLDSRLEDSLSTGPSNITSTAQSRVSEP